MMAGTSSSAGSYRGLLALVIVLGALIMLGVGALIAGAVLGGGRPREAQSFNASIDAPGAHIESTELQGNRILMRLSGGAKGDELVILDAGSGRLLGRVSVNAK